MREHLINSLLLLVTLILLLAFSLLMTLIVNPRSVGEMMQEFDNGRFEMIDCDCTEPLE